VKQEQQRQEDARKRAAEELQCHEAEAKKLVEEQQKRKIPCNN
jgi:hypothetical protein